MRDKNAWACAITQGGHEYVAETDLRRLGLHPYLPQYRASWSPPGAVKPLARKRPLFPKYIFIPIGEARSREMHFARGLAGHKYFLSSAEGVLWVAPAAAVHLIETLENEGAYDQLDVGLGDKVRLKANGPLSVMDLLVQRADAKLVEMLSPLFGGARVTARAESLVRAA
jgi:hypothetical protein